MPKPYAVIVAVDGSRASRAAVSWAAHEASRRGRELFVVHVCDVGTVSPWPDSALDDELRHRAEPFVDEAVALARRVAPDTPVAGAVMVGAPARILMNLSEHSDVLVLGRSGKGALARHLIGSLTARLAAHARCPVVAVPAPAMEVVGPSGPERPGKIVIGLGRMDGWPAAIRFGVAEAERLGVASLVVHVTDAPDPVRRTEIEQAVLTAVASIPVSVQPRTAIRTGRPAQVLAALCRRPDLIVLGQHRQHAPFRPTMLGRTAAGCLELAPCPVAVVPVTDPPRSIEPVLRLHHAQAGPASSPR